MHSDKTNTNHKHIGLMLLLSIGLPVLVLAWLGQDSNWDLRNYHLYNVHAWLHGRYDIDMAPAQLQSWHNPLLDVPLYLLVRVGAPGIIVGLWLTLPMMLALYLTLQLPSRLGIQLDRFALCALALLSVSGGSAFAAIGTSFNDNFVAAGVLGSLTILLSNGHEHSTRLLALAGLLAGLTAGLKLTAAPYCVGLAVMALFSGDWRDAPRRLLPLGIGGILGFLMTYGYWGMTLWQTHGNPVFPYFNQVFHSPDALPLPWNDLRFIASSVTDVLATPFRLLFDSRHYSESTLRDPRLLLGLLGLVLLLCPNRRSVANDTTAQASDRIGPLAVFFVFSMLLWANRSGIYRYALPLELLACAAMVMATTRSGGRYRKPYLAASTVLIIAVTHHANFERSRFLHPMLAITMPPLPTHSLVITGSEQPLAYVALALPDDVPLLSFYNNFQRPDRCTRLQASSEHRLATHEGPLWLLRGGDATADMGEQMASDYYGLRVTGKCLQVITSFEILRLCRLQRSSHPVTCPSLLWQ